MITLVIFIVVIAAVLGLVAMFIYNELVKHREHVRSAYAQIDVQLLGPLVGRPPEVPPERARPR